MMVNQWIFNSLVRLDENLHPVPDLADSWQISEDGKRIVFHLKKNVLWHDGHAFTAEDVKFTLELVLSEKTNTYNRGLFMVDDKPVIARVIDEYTVEIIMAKPFAPCWQIYLFSVWYRNIF
jgi:peptide/nickel transport system substrate-binding protein